MIKKLIRKSVGAFLISLLCCSLAWAKDYRYQEPKKVVVQETPPPIALFTPNLQQPGALIAFGENILSEGVLKLSFFADAFEGPGTHFIDLEPSIVYGITNRLSIELSVPIAASYQAANQNSSGLEDMSVQLEYAYYQNSTTAYTEEATVVGNVGVPTGSANKLPPTGTGAMSYFVGATYNRTYVNWFLFLSPGVNFYDSYHNIEYGNKYLYQGGFGWNLFEIGTRWIIAAVSEFDGQYTAKSKVSGITNPNSGGNIILFTPSISAGATHLSLQAGIGIPIVQNLYGQQTRTNYLLALSMSYVF